MDRPPPPPPLIEYDTVPQQHDYPPSPVSPGQSPDHTLLQERLCLQFLHDMLAHKEEVIRMRNLELHREKIKATQTQNDIEDRNMVFNNDLMKKHRDSVTVLSQTIHSLRADEARLIITQTEKLQDLERTHSSAIEQARAEARSEAEQAAREEVEELNSTYELDKKEQEGTIDGLVTQVSSLKDEETKTAAIIHELKDKAAKLEESAGAHTRSSAAQADKIARLEEDVSAANDALEQVREESRSDTARLQDELDTAGIEIKELIGKNESLATQRSIDKIVYEQAQAAQELAEEENNELLKKNLQLEEADRAAAELRKEVADTHEKHRLRLTELVDLKANNLLLDAQITVNQKAQAMHTSDLARVETSLRERSEEARNLKEKNQELMSKLGVSEKKSAELDSGLKAEKETVKQAEEKRAKEQVSAMKHHFSSQSHEANAEQKEVVRLRKCLATSNLTNEETTKRLSETKTSLDTTSTDLKETNAKLSAALKEVTVAENNAATHFQAKSTAEERLKKAISDSNNFLETSKALRQQLETDRHELATSRKDLEIARKHPEELQRRLNEMRGKLQKCGEHLTKSEARVVELDEEVQRLRTFETKFKEFSEGVGMVSVTPGMKRTHGHSSRETSWSSDSSQSPAKRPRTEPDSSVGASQWHDDRSSRGRLPKGYGGNPNRTPMGNIPRGPRW